MINYIAKLAGDEFRVRSGRWSQVVSSSAGMSCVRPPLPVHPRSGASLSWPKRAVVPNGRSGIGPRGILLVERNAATGRPYHRVLIQS